MAVTLFFWRILKTPRTKVLLNLCAAIAITCALVIFEGLARNKVSLLNGTVKLTEHAQYRWSRGRRYGRTMCGWEQEDSLKTGEKNWTGTIRC